MTISPPFTHGDDTKGMSLSVHNQTKFHLRQGGQYLHLSATKLQTGSRWAWVGTEAQADACRRRFPAARGCVLEEVE